MKTFEQYLISENIDCRAIFDSTLEQYKHEIKDIEDIAPGEDIDASEVNMNLKYDIYKTYEFNSIDTSWWYANGVYADEYQIEFYKDGYLHRIDGPAVINQHYISYKFYDRLICFFEINKNKLTVGDTKAYKNNSEFSNLLSVILRQGLLEYCKTDEAAKNMIDMIVLNPKTVKNIKDDKKCMQYLILHSIQPQIFSDKIAKLLMDKIPLNLAYFLLTKHMELYNNILSCYSDKHKFIENIQEGDDIHHMGIAAALERLIKHEDV